MLTVDVLHKTGQPYVDLHYINNYKSGQDTMVLL
jgi:hypothetical protein